jgi:hypothetical protein
MICADATKHFFFPCRFPLFLEIFGAHDTGGASGEERVLCRCMDSGGMGDHPRLDLDKNTTGGSGPRRGAARITKYLKTTVGAHPFI